MLHRHDEQPSPARVLNRRERALLLAIAQAALPAGNVFPAARPEVVDAVDSFLQAAPPVLRHGYRALLRSLNANALLRYGRRLDKISVERRLSVLHSWHTGGVSRRLAMRGLLMPLKVAHFDNPSFFGAIGCTYSFESQPEPRPRFVRERSHDAATLDGDMELECDVVVIGSGAGGAVVARELADGGAAVIILEQGGFFDRSQFNGRGFEMQRKMYVNAGATFSAGNVGIPIPIGKTVGGTTTINSGTCYRVPRRVMRKWRDSFGLTEFSEEALEPHFSRVEDVLGVAPAQAAYLGGVARVIARGCDALGYEHKPLQRNAPDCDGKGVCCFGCPTDAKRSTNVSYIPLALKAGAELFYNARAEKILIENGRTAGVVATGGGHTLRIQSRSVVVACGSLNTPVFLMRQGLANSSGQLGKNLSIHPASASLALFDEDISGFNAIPQGYSVEEFHDEGILFEGASTPLDIGMAASPFLGKPLIDLAERFDRVATFGFMVEDTSRGRVRLIRDRPIITYWLNDNDLARLKRGQEILSRIFFAAGAKEIYPMINGFEALRGEADLARFRRAKLRARDFDLSAYHPLGTARMGRDPGNSVVGSDHQCHDMPGLYIVDGSALPSSLGVNPQVTIMALATRAATLIGRDL